MKELLINTMNQKLIFCLMAIGLLIYSETILASTRSTLCDQPESDSKIKDIFKQNALKQLALDFGDSKKFIFDIEVAPIDAVMVRVEAYAKYPRLGQKRGQKDYATMRIRGWVSRCQGTTIIQGNSWLANGTLVVNRYSAEQLAGKGLYWGRANATQRFIVFVDSRCQHCHRLLSYAAKLVESGKAFLDIRQVAYLESTEQALKESGLSESSLVVPENPSVSDDELLDRLSGLTGDESTVTNDQAYRDAKAIIESNTAIAQKTLHIITVPGVYIQENDQHGQYRALGRWEINRIFHSE